jgi:hypothetical protein
MSSPLSTRIRFLTARRTEATRRNAVGCMRVDVKGLKVTTLLSPSAIPADLVPPDGQPAGNPVIEVHIDGTGLVAQASLNGRTVRRALKVIAECGADNVNVLLQGNLKAASPGGPLILDSASIMATPRAAKPAEPPAEVTALPDRRFLEPPAGAERRPA